MSVLIFQELMSNRGKSTRYLHTKRKLPMHVNYFPSDASNKKYRVCRKVNDKTVTFGYFNKVYEAEGFVQMLGWGE